MRDPLSLSRTLLVFVGLLLAGAIALPDSAPAQTPAATVKDDGSNVVLQSFLEGQLLVPGPLNSGAIPATGAGVRMMWWPKKAAFRAGEVGVSTGSSDLWNASNIGLRSVAFGQDTRASGESATALGSQTIASDFAATAMGLNTEATGSRSTAMGGATRAIGEESTAMGSFTEAIGAHATAIGFRTSAYTTESISLGRCNAANHGSADGTLLVVGNGPISSGSCDSRSDALVLDQSGNLTTEASIESESGGFVLPDGTVLASSDDVSGTDGDITAVNTPGALEGGATSGDVTLKLPQNCSDGEVLKWDATDWFCSSDNTVLGLPTNTNGASEVDNDDGFVATGATGGSIPTSGAGRRLMWYPGKAAFRVGRVSGSQWDDSNIGDYSLALGENTQASDSYAAAIGGKVTASGFGSTALGFRTNASGSHTTAVNYRTEAATSESLSIGECNSANTSDDGTLFVAGNGTFGGLGFCQRSDALVLDKDAGLLVNGTLGTGSIPATGSGTRMMWYPGDAALRAGEVSGTEWNDGNVGQHSVAFGKNTTASGNKSFAVGENATASGRKSFAAGLDVTATNVETVAMGKNADASGTQAVAIGQDADASGSSATAFGSGTRANAVAALAVNNGTIASADGATAMGFGTIAATKHSLSAGQCNNANQTSDNTLFVVGNGGISSGTCSSHDDAFTVDESGNATASSHDTFSDRRLKTDIEPLETGILQQLGKVRPVRYEFKDQKTHPTGEQLGLIAQDVRKEFPSLVSENSGGYLSLAYPKLTAVLLKGLQEQQAQIKSQRSQINQQQATIDALKRRVQQIDDVKKRLAALESADRSVAAGWTEGTFGLILAVLLGGLLGAGLLRIRRG